MQKTGLRPPTAPSSASPAAQPEAPVPVTGSETLAGRTLKTVSVSELMAAHTEATGEDIFGRGPDGDQQAAAFQRDAAAAVGGAVSAVPGGTQPPGNQQPVPAATQPEDHAGELIALLSDEVLRARQAGNEDVAQQLLEVFNRLTRADKVIHQVRRVKRPNPVLNKLRANLGLGAIASAEVEWAEFKWRFAPIPAALDRWIELMAQQGAVNRWMVLKLAAGLVAIDGEPLWKVFNIDLTADFKQEDEEKVFQVPRYTKLCGVCGQDVGFAVTTVTCAQCGASVDPFEVPMPLRAKYAEIVYGFFQDQFGPYENLQDLYLLMQKAVPDRFGNMATLYPFLKLSPSPSETTPISAPGEGSATT